MPACRIARPGIEASQSNVRAAFFNEDPFPCIKCLGLFSPSCTLLFLLFTCAASVFFLRVQFKRWIARLIVAELTCTRFRGFPNLIMFCQRRIGVSIELREESSLQGCTFLHGASWDRLRAHITRFTLALEIAFECGECRPQTWPRFPLVIVLDPLHEAYAIEDAYE
jgi:hypothetical protein